MKPDQRNRSFKPYFDDFIVICRFLDKNTDTIELPLNCFVD